MSISISNAVYKSMNRQTFLKPNKEKIYKNYKKSHIFGAIIPILRMFPIEMIRDVYKKVSTNKCNSEKLKQYK